MLDEVPPPPWFSLPESKDRSESEIQAEISGIDLVPVVRKALEGRYAGAWYSYENGQTICNIAVVDATTDDQKLVENLRGSEAPLMSLPIRVVAVPYSESDLDTFYRSFTQLQAEGAIPMGLGLDPRLDLGKLVVSLPADEDLASNNLTAASIRHTLDLKTEVGSDAFAFVVGEPGGGSFLGRAEIPLYKGGKEVNLPANAYALTTCTTNFVWADDTSGERKGGTAGHCTQSGDNIRDGTPKLWATAGAENTFWGWVISPLDPNRRAATGDGTFLNNITSVVTESDLRKEIMVSGTASIPVTDWEAMGNLVFGTTLCGTGVGTGNPIKCGSYQVGPLSTSANIDGRYPHSGNDYNIEVMNTSCGSPQLHTMDSGGPIFLDRTVQGDRFAIALGVISHHRNGIQFCWDPVGHINSVTPNHIYLP
jgi:hypothetical protein